MIKGGLVTNADIKGKIKEIRSYIETAQKYEGLSRYHAFILNDYIEELSDLIDKKEKGVATIFNDVIR